MLPYPATRFSKKLSNLCGAKQQLAGVKFSSAGADANKGFLVMGLFTGHMLPSFHKAFKHSSRKVSRPLGVTRVWMPLQFVFSL